MIKTYRGLLAATGQERIRLQTIKGKVGYRIVKFELITQEPGETAVEHVLKIYKSNQTTVDNTIDFSDSDLLAAGYYMDGPSSNTPGFLSVIFDSEIFNQDIFITHSNEDGAEACNYYLELEVIPLDDAGAEYTTLKDMRQT